MISDLFALMHAVYLCVCFFLIFCLEYVKCVAFELTRVCMWIFFSEFIYRIVYIRMMHVGPKAHMLFLNWYILYASKQYACHLKLAK